MAIIADLPAGRQEIIFKIGSKLKHMPEQEIAKVVHYYDKIMVALLKLSGDLSVGETVKFVYQGKESSQAVASMEVNHGKVQSAKAGDEVAVKLDEPTHENAKVYKVS